MPKRMMTTAGKIAVMQAYEDGKQIQFSNNNNEWKDWTIPLEPTWNWVDYDFRIKPEDKPVRMTNRQLAEWCAMAKGLVKYGTVGIVRHYYFFHEYEIDNEVPDNVFVMPKGTTDWVEPTVDIYERDCKDWYRTASNKGE